MDFKETVKAGYNAIANRYLELFGRADARLAGRPLAR